MTVSYRIFRGRAWEESCEEARAFIGEIGPKQIISVSHVSEPPHGVIFVWYQTLRPAVPAGSAEAALQLEERRTAGFESNFG